MLARLYPIIPHIREHKQPMQTECSSLTIIHSVLPIKHTQTTSETVYNSRYCCYLTPLGFIQLTPLRSGFLKSFRVPALLFFSRNRRFLLCAPNFQFMRASHLVIDHFSSVIGTSNGLFSPVAPLSTFFPSHEQNSTGEEEAMIFLNSSS